MRSEKPEWLKWNELANLLRNTLLGTLKYLHQVHEQVKELDLSLSKNMQY